MRKLLIPLALLAAPLGAEDKPAVLAPGEIVAAAPKTDWTAIAPSDLLVMDLAPDLKGKSHRVVIQLMPPPFSQGWVGNIRKLAAAKFWDGLSVNRVQDNYVVQWGDADAEDPKKARALPAGLAVMPPIGVDERGDLIEIPGPEGICLGNDCTDNGYAVAPSDIYPEVRGLESEAFLQALIAAWWGTKRGLDPHADHLNEDSYSDWTDFKLGWPISLAFDDSIVVPHCYGMVGVGRDMPPNSGSGAELYTVIGHAPRHLDRNIALVGRVIEGIEHLSSLPRGHAALGVYDLAQGDERVPIRSVRLGSEVSDLPAYEFLSTESESFARYADARANRRDAFFIRPAGGADICNIPVPVRRSAGSR
jgi:peptidylprolyl isomerase